MSEDAVGTTRDDRPGPEALFEAIRAADGGAVARLLEEHPDLARARTAEGVSPLLLALYHRAGGAVEELRSRAPAADLFEAAAVGDVARLEELLAGEGAAVSAPAPDGWTPLHLAAFFGRPEAAGALLRAGADVSARSRNDTRNTPLHAAAAGGHEDVAEHLLDAGADPEADAAGWAPLHIAAANGSTEVVESLLRAGADPDRGGPEGRTALDLALERGHEAIADRLRAAAGAGA